MTNRFEIVGLAAAGCLWSCVAGAQLDWCVRGEVCRAVLPELPHGPHHDERPWQPAQIQIHATSTASSSFQGDGSAGSLPITLA